MSADLLTAAIIFAGAMLSFFVSHHFEVVRKSRNGGYIFLGGIVLTCIIAVLTEYI